MISNKDKSILLNKNGINSTVYIDESGDLGVNRGTKWFVLSAVIIDKGNEVSIMSRLKQIKNILNVREIHFRDIKDYNRRALITTELKKETFTYINVLIDTDKIDLSKKLNALILYNYACRFLLERVSWFLRDTNRFGNIVLSSRGTGRDKDLMDYIRDKLLTYSDNTIASVFSSISAKSASLWEMLQVADVCATTTFLAHEKSKYGFITPCFMYALSSHLYRRDGKLQKYGLKYFNDNMKPTKEEMNSLKICT